MNEISKRRNYWSNYNLFLPDRKVVSVKWNKTYAVDSDWWFDNSLHAFYSLAKELDKKTREVTSVSLILGKVKPSGIKFSINGNFTEEQKNEFIEILLKMASGDFTWQFYLYDDVDKEEFYKTEEFKKEKENALEAMNNANKELELTSEIVVAYFSHFKPIFKKYPDIDCSGFPPTSLLRHFQREDILKEFLKGEKFIGDAVSALKGNGITEIKGEIIDILTELFPSQLPEFKYFIGKNHLLKSKKYCDAIGNKNSEFLKFSTYSIKELEGVFFEPGKKLPKDWAKRKELFFKFMSSKYANESSMTYLGYILFRKPNTALLEKMTLKDFDLLSKYFPNKSWLFETLAIMLGKQNKITKETYEKYYRDGDSSILFNNEKTISLGKNSYYFFKFGIFSSSAFLNLLKTIISYDMVNYGHGKLFVFEAIPHFYFSKMPLSDIKELHDFYKERIKINYDVLFMSIEYIRNPEIIEYFKSLFTTEVLIENKIFLRTIPEIMERGKEYIFFCLQSASEGIVKNRNALYAIKNIESVFKAIPGDENFEQLCSEIKLCVEMFSIGK